MIPADKDNVYARELWEFLTPENFSRLAESARFIAWRMGPIHGADLSDVAQEAVTRILARAEREPVRFERNEDFLAWMRGILKNVIHEYSRPNRRWTYADVNAASCDRAEQVERKSPDITTEKLEKGIGLLSAAEQEVIRMRLEGKSNREMSLLLGVPDGTVRQRYSRAKKKLASFLKHDRI